MLIVYLWLTVIAELHYYFLLSGYLSFQFLNIYIYIYSKRSFSYCFGYLCRAFYYPQLNSLAVEQDIYNLRRDAEEKETTIKELTTLLNSNEVANCKVILICISRLKFVTFCFCFNQLITLLLFNTEDCWIGRHYTEEKYNNFKIKEGYVGSRTKGKMRDGKNLHYIIVSCQSSAK